MSISIPIGTKQDHPISIFEINDKDPNVLKSNLTEMISRVGIKSLDYYVSIDTSETQHKFRGRADAEASHKIILQVGWLTWLKTWYKENSTAIHQLLINDFFINSKNENAKEELTKACQEARKIILYLSKPNSESFHFLECFLEKTSRPLLTIYYKHKELLGIFSPQSHERDRHLFMLKTVNIEISELIYSAKRLMAEKEIYKIALAIYNYHVQYDMSNQKTFRPIYIQASHRYDFTAGTIKKELKRIFNSYEGYIPSFSSDIETDWNTIKDQVEKVAAQLFEKAYCSVAETFFNFSCQQISRITPEKFPLLEITKEESVNKNIVELRRLFLETKALSKDIESVQFKESNFSSFLAQGFYDWIELIHKISPIELKEKYIEINKNY